MASKKSKILAMALCASVMTGIYAAPVMAAGEIIGINVTGVAGAGLQAEDKVSINGVELATGIVKAAGGEFTQLTVTGGVLTVGGTSINSTNGNTVVGGTLEVTGDTTLAGLKAGATTVESLTVNGAAKVNSLEVDNSATVGDKLTVGNGLECIAQ